MTEPMITHNLVQGSREWHEHRARHFNASDAPAMMGVSPYETRSELVRRLATGIEKEIDAATQFRFDDGHRFEKLALPLAEEIIGQDLYPVTGSKGRYSASFDGLTSGNEAAFEHKRINNAIRSALESGTFTEYHAIQMEQQLLIADAGKCLFMATNWEDEKLVEKMHAWYTPDMELRQRIIAGWEQFEKDLSAYVPPAVTEKPQASAIPQLPALFVQVKGEVTGSNLVEFKDAASAFIANIKTELVTDQDFADAEANVKACKTAEGDLEGAKKAMLAQTSTIDEVMKTIDFIKDQLASKRLMLDKLVKSEKEARKLAIIDKARIAFNAHFTALAAEIDPVRLIAQHPDFAGAMKGLKKLSAMQDAVDTALANGKIAADAVAKDIRAKLTGFQPWSAEYGFLFRDFQEIIYKPLSDFSLIVETRIAAHKEAEEKRLEAERARIQQEEQAKAEARVKAENEAKAQTEINEVVEEILSKSAAPEPVAQPRPAVLYNAPSLVIEKTKRPTRIALIDTIAGEYCVSHQTAADWLVEEFQQMAA